MALARCEQCGPPRKTKMLFSYAHAFVVLKGQSLFCGSPVCLNQATQVWLSDLEENRYTHGERHFRLARHGAEVQLI